MSRRPYTLFLGAALLVSAAGCRSSCGDRHSWFTSNTHAGAPCQLVGSGKLLAGCSDPITGQPVPCGPPTTLIPGGSYPGVMPGDNELPFPAPQT